MVHGPPCATCGTPTRWVVERTTWGCDRCRTLLAVGAPPSQPAMPAYGPAKGGAFAGGNQATPSAAPPGTLPGTMRSPYAQPRASGIAASPPGSPPGALGSSPGVPGHGVASPYGAPPQPQASAPGAPYGSYGAQPGTLSSYGAPNQPPASAPYAGPPSSPYAGPPSAPYAGQGYATPAPAHHGASAPVATAKKSRRGLWITLAVLGVAGGGVAIVLAVRGGGSRAPGSRDELAKATLAALSAGDVDKLVELAGPEDLESKFGDCKPPDKPEQDPAKQRQQLRSAFQKVIDNAKGVTAELVEVTRDSTTKLEVGKELGRCTLTKPVSLVQVSAKVKVTHADKPTDVDTEMAFAEIDGGWYLMTPPPLHPPASCAGAVGKLMKATKDVLDGMQISDAAIGRLGRKLQAHCIDEKWPNDVVECVGAAKRDADADACLRKLPAGKRDELEAALAAIVEQDAKSRAPGAATGSAAPADPTPDPTAAAAVVASDPLPPEEPAASTDPPHACAEWREAIDKLRACKKLPAATRKAMADGLDAVTQRWRDLPSKTAAIRESFDRACESGRDAALDLRKSCR